MTEEEYIKSLKKKKKKKDKRHNPFKDGSTPTSRSYGTGP